MVASDRDTADIARRREPFVRRIDEVLGDDTHTPGLEGVCGERRYVAALSEYDGLADFERPRIGLGDDLKPFHVIVRAT